MIPSEIEKLSISKRSSFSAAINPWARLSDGLDLFINMIKRGSEKVLPFRTSWMSVPGCMNMKTNITLITNNPFTSEYVTLNTCSWIIIIITPSNTCQLILLIPWNLKIAQTFTIPCSWRTPTVLVPYTYFMLACNIASCEYTCMFISQLNLVLTVWLIYPKLQALISFLSLQLILASHTLHIPVALEDTPWDCLLLFAQQFGHTLG